MVFARVLLLSAFNFIAVFSSGLREEFTWTRINYTWPESAPLRPYPQANSDENGNDNYIYKNNIPIGATRWNEKLFITVPRRNPGIPSTLNYVSMSSSKKHNVPLTPYPDWTTNRMDTPRQDRLVSVYRIAVDTECDRLWLVDTGILEYPGNRTIIQPHSIIIIDLKTNNIIKRHWLPESIIKQATALTFIAVDVEPGKCKEAFAYMPDLTGYGLIVYSLKDDSSWRIKHNYFYLESLAGNFNVSGIEFQWPDGTFSVTLSDTKPDGFKDMYFQSMAGTHLFKVSTKILKSKSLATRNYHQDDFKIVANRKLGQQSTGTALHAPTGVIFLGLLNKNSLACWNTENPFSQMEFGTVYRDDERFIYPSDVKVYKDDIIVLTNSMPVFIYKTLNYNKVNFRVWMNSVEAAVEDTHCGERRPILNDPLRDLNN